MTTLILKDATPCPLCLGDDGKPTGRVYVAGARAYASCSCPAGEAVNKAMVFGPRGARKRALDSANAVFMSRRSLWRRVRDWLGV